jgi:hypothetical protein
LTGIGAGGFAAVRTVCRSCARSVSRTLLELAGAAVGAGAGAADAVAGAGVDGGLMTPRMFARPASNADMSVFGAEAAGDVTAVPGVVGAVAGVCTPGTNV